MSRSDADHPYYLIAGRGFVGLLDYATLLATDAGRVRIGKRTVLFAGEPDPRSRYRPIRMGQWLHLLCLPHFGDRPRYRHLDRFLPSVSFAASLREQRGRFPPHEIAEDRIRAVCAIDGGYEVTIGERVVRADRIDVCTGVGEARKIEFPGAGDLASPRLVNGYRFLERGTRIQQRGSVLVVGSNPTAAWCVEAALGVPNYVVWAVAGNMDCAFPKSGGNDGLRRVPASKLRLCPCGVSRVDPEPDGSVRVHLEKRESIVVDQVVVANGSDRSEVAEMFRTIVPMVPKTENAIRSAAGRLIGIQSSGGASGSVRFLGAAAFVHPAAKYLNQRSGPGRDRMPWSYFEHVCAQMRGDGQTPTIPMAAHNIAEANGCFVDAVDTNVNTAPHDHLSRIGGPKWAHEVCETRAAMKGPLVEIPAEWSEYDLKLSY